MGEKERRERALQDDAIDCAGPDCEAQISRVMGSPTYFLMISEYVPDGSPETGSKVYLCSQECAEAHLQEGLDGPT